MFLNVYNNNQQRLQGLGPLADWVLCPSPHGTASALHCANPHTDKPSNELFGKFTWRIESFSQISKRELRSTQFDVGEYKWCV